MFTNLSDVVKLPIAVLIGVAVSVLFYEGVKLPIFGQLVPGIVWYRVDAAKSNMVAVYERDALQAQLDRERELREAAAQSLAAATKRADEATKAKQAAEAQVDRLAEEAAKDATLSRPNESDKKWLSDR